MHDTKTPAVSAPAAPVRAVNASLASCFAGLQPLRKITGEFGVWFQFPNGQIRRQIGEGHSTAERRARREARRALRQVVWTGSRTTAAQLAGLILEKTFR